MYDKTRREKLEVEVGGGKREGEKIKLLFSIEGMKKERKRN